MTHTTDTGAQEWTFERIQEAVKKVAHNVCPYKGTQAVTAFQAEQLMGLVRNDYEATIATQAARIVELEKQVAWKEGLIRQLTEVDMPAMGADNERLRAELAEAKREIELINEANAPMRPRAFWDDKLTERRGR